VKAKLLFQEKGTWDRVFGGSVTIFMDCYEVESTDQGFDKAFTFSWIAFDPEKPDRRVLMDQHRGRPCHLHIGDKEIFMTVEFDSLDKAISFFFLEVKKHFGELIL
jgi:hypothetical protein